MVGKPEVMAPISLLEITSGLPVTGQVEQFYK